MLKTRTGIPRARGTRSTKRGLRLIFYADDRFKGTPEASWLAENAYKYGFILRYPEGKEPITGYMFEPWHYRYVGVENAAKIYASGLTLEEYFGITSAYK